MAGSEPDFSRSRREFQLRLAACRACVAEGLPNLALCNCLLALIEDLGGQVSDLRHDFVTHRYTSDLTMEQYKLAAEGTLRQINFRLFGYDDEDAHPEEVGVLGDLRNRLREQTKWIKRGVWALATGAGLLFLFVIEQAIAPLFHP